MLTEKKWEEVQTQAPPGWEYMGTFETDWCGEPGTEERWENPNLIQDCRAGLTPLGQLVFDEVVHAFWFNQRFLYSREGYTGYMADTLNDALSFRHGERDWRPYMREVVDALDVRRMVSASYLHGRGRGKRSGWMRTTASLLNRGMIVESVTEGEPKRLIGFSLSSMGEHFMAAADKWCQYSRGE